MATIAAKSDLKSGPNKLPAGALRFDAGPCQFGKLVAGTTEEQSKNVAVRILARTGQPVDNWFWGKVIHDLAGMELHKPALTIDYIHSDREILGYLDTFDIESGDLIVSGALVPFADGDRASEVIYKANQGVPYEASIFFDGPLRIEEIEAGAKAEVNGYTVDGPSLIFRQWTLRNVAIAPHGVDRNTKTQFSAGDEVAVTMFTEEKNAMANAPETTHDATAQQLAEGEATKTTPPPLPAAGKQAEEKKRDEKPETPPAGRLAADGTSAEQTAADPRAECKRFLTAFGPEGAAWFAEGKSFADAQEAHGQKLAAENADLKKKLSAASLGETEPVTFADGEGGGRPKDRKLSYLPDGLDRFASGLKFAGRD